MPELAYPRWVNRRADGVGSVIAETAEHEAEILARWAAEPTQPAPLPPTVAPKPLSGDDLEHAWGDGVVSALEAAREAGVAEETISLIREAFDAKVTEAFAPPEVVNALTATPVADKAKGGWPKGKPRGKRPQVSVN